VVCFIGIGMAILRSIPAPSLSERVDGGIAGMFGRARRTGMREMAIDFVLVFALIWGSAFAVAFARSRAHAEGLRPAAVARTATTDRARARTADAYHSSDLTAASQASSYVVLSLAVAAVAALDLAFWRHLRRAYASPRRGRRRG
jgi:hypothetical protein